MSDKQHARRHLIIPDAQIKPGQSLDHIDWAAKAIIEYLPDVIVVIGDWWHFQSLSRHEAPGSAHLENTRIIEDIRAGNVAFRRLNDPVEAEINRRAKNHKKRWNPRRVFLFGNHEWQLKRVVTTDPKFDGVLTLDDLETPGFERHDFLKIVEIDGIKYCHFFPNPHTGKAINGTIVNRLGHIGATFVQGHQQGFLYASKQYPDHIKHGIVCGRFYVEHEHYRPGDVQNSEWNGLVVLNQVHKGDFDLMPLRMDYLRRKYG